MEIGTGTVGVAFSRHLTFTITDGATDFVAGDRFTIPLAAPTATYVLAPAAATDGSEAPIAILAEDTDASAADTETTAYFTGPFWGTGWRSAQGTPSPASRRPSARRSN